MRIPWRLALRMPSKTTLAMLSLWIVACHGSSGAQGHADASTDSSTSDAGTPAPTDSGLKGLRDLGDGTVHDPASSLTWQQSLGAATYSWPGAKAYCEALVLGGSKWALPTLDQLRTIVVMGRSPSIDSATFPNTPADDFWSSTTGRDSPGYADGVSFEDGSWFSAVPEDRHYARCVRAQ